jgi:hypothetical protein
MHIFCRIFLSNDWWQVVYKNQQSRQTGSRNLMGPKTLPTIWGTYMKLVTKYQISAINSCWEKCAYMFNVYKNQLYMPIYNRIILSNYWWQKSGIWSQASYRYPISREAFFDPSDSYFLFAEEWGYHKRALAHSSSCSYMEDMLCCTLASSTTKTGRHDIAEILLKVALNTINQIKSNSLLVLSYDFFLWPNRIQRSDIFLIV